MNILFVAEYYFANPPLIQLSKELVKRKHNVSVITSFRNVDKKGINEEGIRIFEVTPFVTIYKIPRALSFPLLRTSKIIKEQNIEIVHAPNDYSTNVTVAALIAKATGKPFVYTIQGPGTRTGHLLVDSLAHACDLTVGRWLAQEAQKVVLLSKGLISTTEKLGVEQSKIVVIPSGVDITHFDPERHEVQKKVSQLKDKLAIDDKIIIGYAGRLYPAKGLIYLFSAVKKIQDKHSDIAILIVGDGTQRKELETIARDLKVKTIFTGWQSDLPLYYSLMDIFVLPSLFEGLPNVILEAMAMKKAVVATKVGGIPDVASDGENGFLVPARDVPQLAFALEKLIEDDTLRGKMGVMNRQKVKACFLWSKTAEKVEKVYREITSFTGT